MIEYNLTGPLESFERAFSSNISGCSMECHCGKVYYDAFNDGYDWEEGEFEALEDSDDSFPVEHSVGSLYINGSEYVSVCKCWHEKAEKLLSYLLSESHQIAQFLTLEKERASKEAAKMPTVGDGWINMDSAPKDGRNISTKDKRGKIQTAHFAQDLSGEFQPMFKGWFTRSEGDGYHEIKPVQWRKLGIL